MNSIFNSLGSNYSPEFVKKSKNLLFSPWSWGGQNPKEELVKTLKKRFAAEEVILTYKGRQAITLILNTLGLKQGDEVILQAFTCWAVEEGIRNSGCKPVFADTTGGSLNPSVTNLINAYKKATKPKAVLIQHTLGLPADIKAIKAFCAKNDLYLIEDLAHSFGSTDNLGVPLGTHSDAVALSFGRDKIIDAVSGGAAVFKKAPLNTPVLPNISKKQIIIDLLYPSVTQIIRKTHHSIVGKIIHKLLKKTPLLITPIQSTTTASASLPAPHAQLVLHSLSNLDSQLHHRQQVVKAYLGELEKPNIPSNLPPNRVNYLRFPMLVKNRGSLITHLKSFRYYIPDTWYRKTIDTGSLVSKISHYQPGSCPNAENLSEQIINLPTHINISPKEATKLAILINQYVHSHQSN